MLLSLLPALKVVLGARNRTQTLDAARSPPSGNELDTEGREQILQRLHIHTYLVTRDAALCRTSCRWVGSRPARSASFPVLDGWRIWVGRPAVLADEHVAGVAGEVRACQRSRRLKSNSADPEALAGSLTVCAMAS